MLCLKVENKWQDQIGKFGLVELLETQLFPFALLPVAEDARGRLFERMAGCPGCQSLKGHYGKYLALQIVLGFILSQEQYIYWRYTPACPSKLISIHSKLYLKTVNTDSEASTFIKIETRNSATYLVTALSLRSASSV